MLRCSTLIVAAALANAAPSSAAVHPTSRNIGFSEGDLSGSGKEMARGRQRSAIDREDRGSSRSWLEMAARARNLAQWIDPQHRGVLLNLAEEYEARARRAADKAPG
jgi:hypothetical protein